VNGVGGVFYDCHAPYEPAETTLALARTAADAWSAGTELTAFCDGHCVARQTTSQPGQCGVWCYGESSLAGHVNVNSATNSCFCPTTQSPVWR
jgi:hypothetical protein